jgi:hypothetical protein
MPKTITLQNAKIQSIVLTNLEVDSGNNETGFASNINYLVEDDNGVAAMYKQSTKYTRDTTFSSQHMSETAETHLKAYVNEMVRLMVEREEL